MHRYFEKVAGRFTRDLFRRWNEAGVSHSLTVIYFSRTLLDAAPGRRGGAPLDQDGVPYEDTYQVRAGHRYAFACAVLCISECAARPAAAHNARRAEHRLWWTNLRGRTGRP